MVWGKRLRFMAGVCFALMWIPVGFMIYVGITGGDESAMEPVVVPLVVFSIAFSVLLVGSFSIGGLEKERIKKNGIPAKATILRVSDTGTMINDQPMLGIELEVHPPYDSPFVTTTEYVVPYSVLPRVRPGAKVRVYYIPGSTEVALEEI